MICLVDTATHHLVPDSRAVRFGYYRGSGEPGASAGSASPPATFHWGEPYVLLGYETHEVAAQGGEAEVGVSTGAQHPRTLARRSYAHDTWRITIPLSEIKYSLAWSS